MKRKLLRLAASFLCLALLVAGAAEFAFYTANPDESGFHTGWYAVLYISMGLTIAGILAMRRIAKDFQQRMF
ncbi:MAG: hypothetical protein V1813_02600 [Candidatus Aenigmatarchaeota archaeon]